MGLYHDAQPWEIQARLGLGVSRETVRAAIGLLQARRMIEVNQGARTRVLGRGSMPLHESVGVLGGLKHHDRAAGIQADASARCDPAIAWRKADPRYESV